MMANSQTTAVSEGLAGASAPAGGLGPAPASGPSSPIRSPDPVLAKEHAEFAAFHEGYVRNYVGLADTKATLVFGASAGLITYLFGKPTFFQLVLSPALTVASVLVILAMVFLSLAAVCALLVVVPRRGHSGEGIVFFGSVAAFPSAASYLEQVARRSESELAAARIKHCYDVSKVCSRKYDMLRRAFWFAALGLVFALPVLGTLN